MPPVPPLGGCLRRNQMTFGGITRDLQPNPSAGKSRVEYPKGITRTGDKDQSMAITGRSSAMEDR